MPTQMSAPLLWRGGGHWEAPEEVVKVEVEDRRATAHGPQSVPPPVPEGLCAAQTAVYSVLSD